MVLHVCRYSAFAEDCGDGLSPSLVGKGGQTSYAPQGWPATVPAGSKFGFQRFRSALILTPHFSGRHTVFFFFVYLLRNFFIVSDAARGSLAACAARVSSHRPHRRYTGRSRYVTSKFTYPSDFITWPGSRRRSSNHGLILITALALHKPSSHKADSNGCLNEGWVQPCRCSWFWLLGDILWQLAQLGHLSSLGWVFAPRGWSRLQGRTPLSELPQGDSLDSYREKPRGWTEASSGSLYKGINIDFTFRIPYFFSLQLKKGS